MWSRERKVLHESLHLWSSPYGESSQSAEPCGTIEPTSPFRLNKWRNKSNQLNGTKKRKTFSSCIIYTDVCAWGVYIYICVSCIKAGWRRTQEVCCLKYNSAQCGSNKPQHVWSSNSYFSMTRDIYTRCWAGHTTAIKLHHTDSSSTVLWKV